MTTKFNYEIKIFRESESSVEYIYADSMSTDVTVLGQRFDFFNGDDPKNLVAFLDIAANHTVLVKIHSLTES